MFVVLSKFTILSEESTVTAVKDAFVKRPHLVETVAGFIRLDVLSPVEKPQEIWLLPYWTGENSFRLWYWTHQYQVAHRHIPAGLKLASYSLELHFFKHVSS